MKLGAQSRGISFRSRQPANSILGGRNASRLRGRGLDFEELRAYQPGDDIRALDWRVTARTKTPFVRVYREEKERPVTIALDQRSGMFFGSVRAMKSVVGAQAAAIVAHQVVQAGDRIGAVVFGDTGRAVFEPERSQKQVTRILGSICEFNRALLEPPTAETNLLGLNEALEQVARLVTHDHLVVLITDLSGADETTRRLATRLRRRNDVIILWVSDPLESSLPDVGEAILGNGDLQVQVDTGKAGVRERFAQDVKERGERAASLALRYDVPLIHLSTDQEIVTELRRQLERYRSKRRA